MIKPTIVTGLFNIGRDKYKTRARPWKLYLKWFKNCLSLDCDMVVFVEEGTAKFVRANRPLTCRTEIVVTKLNDFRLYRHADKMKKVMVSENFSKQLALRSTSDSTLPEVTDPLYNIVNYSKISMLKRASDLNPFDSDYFIWLDAGCMGNGFILDNKGKKFPHPKRLCALDKDKIYITCKKLPQLTDLDLHKYFNLNIREKIRFNGFIIGAGKEDIYHMEDFLDAFLDEVLDMGLIDSEQMALSIYYLRGNADRFNPCMWKRNTWYTGFVDLLTEAK